MTEVNGKKIKQVPHAEKNYGVIETVSSPDDKGQRMFGIFMGHATPERQKETLLEAIKQGKGVFCLRYLQSTFIKAPLNEEEFLDAITLVIRCSINRVPIEVLDQIDMHIRIESIQDELFKNNRYWELTHFVGDPAYAHERKALAKRLISIPEGAQEFLTDLSARGAVSLYGFDLADVYDTASMPGEQDSYVRDFNLVSIAQYFGISKHSIATPFRRESVMRCLDRLFRVPMPADDEISAFLYGLVTNLKTHGVCLEDIIQLCIKHNNLRPILAIVDHQNKAGAIWKDISPDTLRNFILAGIDGDIPIGVEFFNILEKKGVNLKEIIQYWAESKHAKSLIRHFSDGSLKEYGTPAVFETAVRSMCKCFPAKYNYDSVWSIPGLDFEAYLTCILETIPSERFRDILIEEGRVKELIRIASALPGIAEVSFDLRGPVFEKALIDFKNHTEDGTIFRHFAAELLDVFPHVRMPISFYSDCWRELVQKARIASEGYVYTSSLLKAHECLEVPESPYLTRLTQEFGFECPEAYFNFCCKDLPVFEKDFSGMPEFNKRIETLRRERILILAKLLKGELTASYLEEEPLRIELLMDAARFNRSEWGLHGENNFLSLVRRMEECQLSGGKGMLDPLPKEYIGGIMTVNLKGKDKPIEALTKDFIGKYKILLEDLHNAHEMMEPKEGGIGDADDPWREEEHWMKDPVPDQTVRLATILRGTRKLLKEIHKEIRSTRDAQKDRGNEKALPRLEKALAAVESIDLRKIVRGQRGIGDLVALAAEFANGSQERRARQLLIMLAIHQGRNIWHPSEHEVESIKYATPAREDIAALENALNHITYKETWLPMVKDNKLYVKALRNLLPTRFLEEQLAKYEDTKGDKTMEINVHPARGLALELSGHIGDACWASQHDLINAKFPNILALIFTRKTKLGDAPIGDALIIETTTKTGEKAMVIRGLNPLQKVMGGDRVSGRADEGSLMPELFVAELKRYLNPIAKARGAKVGIVIDHHSGGSGTNRPILHAYLYNKLRPTLARMEPTGDSTFNGYDIREVTYYL